MGTALTLAQKKDKISDLLNSKVGEMAKVMPAEMTPERLTRIALTAHLKDPKLFECTPASLLEALMTCSELGLEPDGQKAHLIPFGNRVTFIPNYKGLIELAHNSGEIAGISAAAVYENDTFSYSLGTDPHINHIPVLSARGKLIAAYAVAHYKDTGLREQFTVLLAEDIAKIKAVSKSSTKPDSPWVKWPDQMWIKSAIKRLTKTLPSAPGKLKRAVALDNEANFDIDITQPDPNALANSVRTVEDPPEGQGQEGQTAAATQQEAEGIAAE